MRAISAWCILVGLKIASTKSLNSDDIFSSTLECPKGRSYFLTCETGEGGEVIAGNPKGNVCWTKDEDRWACWPKVNGSCDESEIDITSCDIKLPQVPICPNPSLYKLKCKNPDGGDSAFYDYDRNVCWSIDDHNQESWLCNPKQNNDTCRLGELDITGCKRLMLPLQCPEKDHFPLECLSGDGDVVAVSAPGDNVCWSRDKKINKWTCWPKVDGACTKNEIDITKCSHNGPIAPKCPKPEEFKLECQPETSNNDSDGAGLTFYDPGNNVCWNKSDRGLNHSWVCSNYESSGKCKDGWLDVSICPKLSAPPKCPTKNSYFLQCTTLAKTLALAGDPQANLCWTSTSNGWSCQPKNNGKCGHSELDISTCSFDSSNRLKCDDIDKEAICQTKMGLSNFLKPGENICWSKSPTDETKYLCQEPNNSAYCRPTDLDIRLCKKQNSRSCLPKESKCYLLTKVYGLGDEDKLPCWVKVGKKAGRYFCTKKIFDKCLPKFEDITKCT